MDQGCKKVIILYLLGTGKPGGKTWGAENLGENLGAENLGGGGREKVYLWLYIMLCYLSLLSMYNVGGFLPDRVSE